MENPLQRLLDMAVVHDFYLSLIRQKLGFGIPIPQEVQGSIEANRAAPAEEQLARWLALLDLAISPVMVRDGLNESTPKATAEAVLRYAFLRRSPLEPERDKADFIATFLFRRSGHPVRSLAEWSSVDRQTPFERELHSILGNDDRLLLPEEHRQLLREFPFIRQEVEEVDHFDELIDSGIMQRVRDIKQRFGESFYHPRVLAMIAEYNVFMSGRFDELFREAARSIKQFAATVQEAGGSILARVDGDVTVKQLVDVQEDAILQKEYVRAQEQLRNLSKFKKAVDRRKLSTTSAPVKKTAQTPGPIPARPAAPAPSPLVSRGGSAAEIHGTLDKAVEDGKLQAMIESIRTFILAADQKSASSYPMRTGSLPLTAAEIDAFKADYREEKSFRGDYAYLMSKAVGLTARMLTELDEYRQRQYSAYLWKPHADALAYLLQSANKTLEESSAVLKIAEGRGLIEKVNAMNTTVQRLRAQCLTVARTLENVGSVRGH